MSIPQATSWTGQAPDYSRAFLSSEIRKPLTSQQRTDRYGLTQFGQIADPPPLADNWIDERIKEARVGLDKTA